MSTYKIDPGSIHRPSLRDGAVGVVHYRHDNSVGSATALSFYGSLDGENFCLIETFANTADVLKEIALCPYIAVTTGTNNERVLSNFSTSDDFGASEVRLNETR